MKIPDPTLAGNLRGDYLGARMLAARQKSGLNKKDAAERIGIAVATLSRIERGTTGMVSDPSTITRAAKLYAGGLAGSRLTPAWYSVSKQAGDTQSPTSNG